jgi:hypothetical protein
VICPSAHPEGIYMQQRHICTPQPRPQMHVKGHHYAPAALTPVKNGGVNGLLDWVAHRKSTDLLEKRTTTVPADIRTPNRPSRCLAVTLMCCLLVWASDVGLCYLATLYVAVIVQTNERIRSFGVMIMTGENRNTLRKTCLNTTLLITNSKWTGLGLNPCLRCERPKTA